MFTEFSPRFHGYCAHSSLSAVVGVWPKGEVYEKAYQAALAAYRAGFNALRPGITVGELTQALREPIVAAGFNTSTLFHGEGIGNETIGRSRNPEERTLTVIREGQTIALEPGARSPDTGRGLRIGEVVLVTRDGRRRLGTREPAIRICK